MSFQLASALSADPVAEIYSDTGGVVRAVREDLNKGLERGPGTRDLFTGGSYRAKWRGLV
jgi:hypothetical protein